MTPRWAPAEVAALEEYRGSYIMAFAAYNAGRGWVQEWVAQHGDPRDPNVDAVTGSSASPSPRRAITVQRGLGDEIESRAAVSDAPCSVAHSA
jgi:hypothetical protein